MNDLFDQQPATQDIPGPTEAKDSLKLDPKLLEKALKRMQGLVRGNGLSINDVTLGTEDNNVTVKTYRFSARTSLKLVSEYGVKTEPGRNTKAELMPSQAEFNKALSQTVIDARSIPERRKQIIDFIFSRADKGFGIKDQRIKFHELNRDFVQHEKCVSCKASGRISCGKCHGHGLLTCINCQGRRQVVCPRCRGTTKINSAKGPIACQFCRSDGKINCPKCTGRGQTKCPSCAATGALQCQPCAGTGCISHLAHIEIFAQMHFDFDRTNLPSPLCAILENSASKMVEKNDIEVSLIDIPPHTDKLVRADTLAANRGNEVEPSDTIWLDYDAICPYGGIAFKLKERIISANLLGFQARLMDCPPFLNDLTKIGQQALIEAATGHGDVIGKIKKAAKYNLLRDTIVQTIRLKNLHKAHQLLAAKYMAGINPQQLELLVRAADTALGHITKKSRIMGMTVGLGLFALLTFFYFTIGGRELLLAQGLSEKTVRVIDGILIPLGTLMGVYGSKFVAKWSRDAALKTIVPDEVLNKVLPKAGKVLWWSAAGAVAITASSVLAAVLSEASLPQWISHLIH